MPHLSGGGWDIDCPVTYTHPSKVQLRQSLEGIGTIDMEVNEYTGLTEDQRKKAIAKRDNADKKKVARL